MADDLNQEIDEAVSATDTEILNEAFQDEAPAAEPESPAPEKTEAPQGEQPRNERGQFAPKEAKAEADPKAPARTPEDEAPIPSWRAREIADERRQAQAERDQLRAELARMQARQAAQQPQQQQQQDIDPLLDPQGFANKLRSEFNQQISRVELNANLKMAHRFHGEKFE